MENENSCSSIKGVSSSEILDIISSKYDFKDSQYDKNSPARYYELESGYRFGIIEPHKDEFCKSCNKVRLTAEGDLIPCLYFDEAVSIKDSIKKKDVEDTHKILQNMLDNKPEKNRWSEDGEVSSRKFFETGG
jgi:cyclic pyranopterin phosphate synthase